MREMSIKAVYRGFYDLANELAEKDTVLYPLDEKKKHPDTKEDRRWKHLLGMMELYSVRYGDPDQILQIVEFLERKLFPTGSDGWLLTRDEWNNLRESILTGEYLGQKEGVK